MTQTSILEAESREISKKYDMNHRDYRKYHYWDNEEGKAKRKLIFYD